MAASSFKRWVMDSEVDTVSLWKISVIEIIEIPQDWNAKLILYRCNMNNAWKCKMRWNLPPRLYFYRFLARNTKMKPWSFKNDFKRLNFKSQCSDDICLTVTWAPSVSVVLTIHRCGVLWRTHRFNCRIRSTPCPHVLNHPTIQTMEVCVTVTVAWNALMMVLLDNQFLTLHNVNVSAIVYASWCSVTSPMYPWDPTTVPFHWTLVTLACQILTAYPHPAESWTVPVLRLIPMLPVSLRHRFQSTDQLRTKLLIIA